MKLKPFVRYLIAGVLMYYAIGATAESAIELVLLKDGSPQGNAFVLAVLCYAGALTLVMSSGPSQS